MQLAQKECLKEENSEIKSIVFYICLLINVSSI